jgi:hypothetical protein
MAYQDADSKPGSKPDTPTLGTSGSDGIRTCNHENHAPQHLPPA